MLPILSALDFEDGITRISQNGSTTTQLDAYISEIEPISIKRLLNSLMLSEIMAQATLSEKYNDLINGVEWFDNDGNQYSSDGLKEALRYFVYYQFMGDNFISTPIGNTQSTPELSTQLQRGVNAQIVRQRFNRGVDIYNDVVLFIVLHTDMPLEILSESFNSGIYTLGVDSTKYLYDGDIITLGNNNYIVSNVVQDVSFDITEVSGLTFIGDVFKHSPFRGAKLEIIDKQWD